MIRDYYNLTKPGIIYGNALVAVAGFFFASKGTVDWWLLCAMLVGLSAIIACGCVINNIFDRKIDAKMERTKKRAMVAGTISQQRASLFAAALGTLGIEVLWHYTNLLTLFVALAGLGIYVCLYTPLKPRSAMALFVGAAAGAVPPVVGYVAVTNTLDWFAGALFVALYLWQIPHFLAIATYRYTEYTAAGVPLFIHKEPTEVAKKRGKKVFFYSLVVLLFFCAALMLHR
jgi:protoheme IX farnesyltransferase